MVRVLVGAVGAALLPVVVQPHRGVAQVQERRGHAVHAVAAAGHAQHDAFHQRLVNAASVEVPGPPRHAGRCAEAIVKRGGGERAAEHSERAKEAHQALNYGGRRPAS